jgi:CRISPR-associated protein Csb2
VNEGSGEIVAVMSLTPLSDPTVRAYLRPAAEWATVTPVVLPGYDDPGHYRRRADQETDATVRRRLLEKLGARIDGLLRKSLAQAGWPEELARHAELEWRSTGFLPGVQSARRYGVPKHLRKYSTLHVRLRWRDAQGRLVALPGPLCIGAGRFYGLGLMAPM